MNQKFNELYKFETHWQSQSGTMVPYDVTSVEELPAEFRAQIGSNSRAMLYADNLRIAEVTPKPFLPRRGEFQNIKLSKQEFVELMVKRQLPQA